MHKQNRNYLSDSHTNDTSDQKASLRRLTKWSFDIKTSWSGRWSVEVVLMILVDLELTKIRSVEIADDLLSGLNCLHKGWAQSCLWNEVQKLDVWKYLFRLAWHQTQAWLISKRQGVECGTWYLRQYFLNKNNHKVHVKHNPDTWSLLWARLMQPLK